jgi:hypothetical protein
MFLAIAAACVPSKLTPEGRNVWLTTQAAYQSCRPLGHIEGRPALGYDDSKTVARNKAARIGANYVHVDEVVDGIVRATVYDCPTIEPAATAVPEAPGPRQPVLANKPFETKPFEDDTPKKDTAKKAKAKKKAAPAAATPTRSAE